MDNLENFSTKENTPTCEVKDELHKDNDIQRSSDSNEKVNIKNRKFFIKRIFKMLFDNSYSEFLQIKKDLFSSLIVQTNNYNCKEIERINLQIKKGSYYKINSILQMGNISLFNIVYSFMLLDNLIFQYPSIFSEISFEK